MGLSLGELKEAKGSVGDVCPDQILSITIRLYAPHSIQTLTLNEKGNDTQVSEELNLRSGLIFFVTSGYSKNGQTSGVWGCVFGA